MILGIGSDLIDIARIDLTITDEPPLAQALVVISALPAGMAPETG